MNTRFSLIALSIGIAVSSLALVITVVGVTASSVSGEAIGIPSDADTRDNKGSRLLADQRLNISQDELLTLTDPISIYLPVLEYDYIDPAVDRAALMALYNSTNGDEWINNTGWGTDTSYCDWYGVTCDENGHVTILDLSQNRLTGTLPSEIGNLANLKELLLWENQLLTLPPEIGKLESLRWLALNENLLPSLPPEIGKLTKLEILSLDFNQLAFLPPEIGKLANLLRLELGYNQLTSLPPEIGNLSNLQSLYFSFAKIE